MDSWDGFWEHVASGVVIAGVAALFALLVTDRFARKRAEAFAHRERDLATARDLYQVAGELFAAWKLWDFHSRTPGPHDAPYDEGRHSEIVQLAGSAEGQCEALIVRIALEHDLAPSQETALWCLREAFKQLRKAVRTKKALAWWASDIRDDEGHREYQAYKGTVTLVGSMLTLSTRRRRSFPTFLKEMLTSLRRTFHVETPMNPMEGRAATIARVTSHQPPMAHDVERDEGEGVGQEWVLVAEALIEQRLKGFSDSRLSSTPLVLTNETSRSVAP